MTQGPSIVCCLLDNTTENVRAIAYLHRTFSPEEFSECMKYRQRTPFLVLIFWVYFKFDTHVFRVFNLVLDFLNLYNFGPCSHISDKKNHT